MKKSFRNIKILRNWDIIWWIIFFIFLVIVHLRMTPFGDDLSFREALNDRSIMDYALFRYQQWTSRQIIETLMVTLLKLPFTFWTFINFLLCMSVPASLQYLTGVGKNSRWITICLFMLYPMNDMNSAGWCATMMNYMWPLALGLIALIPLKKILTGKKIFLYEIIISFFALVYAANQEQVCAILLGIYTIGLGYCLFKRFRFKLYNKLLILYFFNWISLVYILTCPGNFQRKEAETHWFTDFKMLTLFDKMEIGFSSTMSAMLTFPLFFVTALVIAVLACQKLKMGIYKVLCFVPVTVSAICILADNLLKTDNDLRKILFPVGVYGTMGELKYYKIVSYLPFLIYVLILVIFIVSIWFVMLDKLEQGLFAVVVFLGGFASRVIMGLSPTVWVSAERTYIFLYFSIIYTGIVLYMETNQKNDSGCKSWILKYAIMGMALLNGWSLLSQI